MKPTHADTGCALAPKCLECPYATCKEDGTKRTKKRITPKMVQEDLFGETK